MNLITLKSSHGELVFRDDTGVVVEVREETDEPGALTCIYAVDVEILRKVDPKAFERGESDILFAGLSEITDRGSTIYTPPEWDYINELH